MCKRLELTFGILKPHVLQNPFALKEIQNLILANKFQIVRSRKLLISHKEAEHFYGEHKGKFFYNRLQTFMTSGQSLALILTKENAIEKWRELMGPTKVYKAIYSHPDSIRGKYGLSDTRNASHGSDSSESFEKEAKVFFPDFDIQKWYKKEEEYFRNFKIEFIEKLFIHKIMK